MSPCLTVILVYLISSAYCGHLEIFDGNDLESIIRQLPTSMQHLTRARRQTGWFSLPGVIGDLLGSSAQNAARPAAVAAGDVSTVLSGGIPGGAYPQSPNSIPIPTRPYLPSTSSANAQSYSGYGGSVSTANAQSLGQSYQQVGPSQGQVAYPGYTVAQRGPYGYGVYSNVHTYRVRIPYNGGYGGYAGNGGYGGYGNNGGNYPGYGGYNGGYGGYSGSSSNANAHSQSGPYGSTSGAGASSQGFGQGGLGGQRPYPGGNGGYIPQGNYQPQGSYQPQGNYQPQYPGSSSNAQASSFNQGGQSGSTANANSNSFNGLIGF